MVSRRADHRLGSGRPAAAPARSRRSRRTPAPCWPAAHSGAGRGPAPPPVLGPAGPLPWTPFPSPPLLQALIDTAGQGRRVRDPARGVEPALPGDGERVRQAAADQARDLVEDAGEDA